MLRGDTVSNLKKVRIWNSILLIFNFKPFETKWNDLNTNLSIQISRIVILKLDIENWKHFFSLLQNPRSMHFCTQLCENNSCTKFHEKIMKTFGVSIYSIHQP